MTYLDRLAQAPKHEPEYHIDERWDELYVFCAACGDEWPCDQATPNLAPHDGDKAGKSGNTTERK